MNSLVLVCVLSIVSVSASYTYNGISMRRCKNYKLEECEPMTSNNVHLVVPGETKVLKKNHFGDEEGLMDITVTPGELRELKPWCFSNLPSLKRIYLGGSLLKIIPFGVFNSLPVYYVYLAGNKIHTIETEAFADMETLREIYLDKNSLVYFDPGWFALEGKSSNLETLNIHHNKIKSITKKAFYNFPKIKTVDFSFNEIEYISGDIFRHNADITLFDVSFNKLTTLSPNLLANVNKVDKFVIAFNFIDNLDKEVIEEAKVKSASIHPNQWICSCLKDVETSLFKNNVQSFSSGDTFKSRENLLKYQLPVNTQYLASNLSICYETWKTCEDSQSSSENLEAQKAFQEVLTKTYDKVNVKCTEESGCLDGLVCRSDYCWALIKTAYYFDNDPMYFVWRF
ncbi:unnamed protein product [Brassicogethes aeneus]|uniref:Uncharacterized protein n=1 Tax=Brassicogethes aeneus TaxID=1431903 RepID=A0A9P0B5Y2_BRAAE|nr:unnamed protein product [Brassicogethes aeneus]